MAGLPGVLDEFGSRRISSRTSLRETNLVTAMLRAYPECGTVPPPCSPCGAAGNVNLHEDLGLNRRQSSIPTYSPSAPRSKWNAVQQGQAAAEDERRRLDLGIAPLPDVTDLLGAQGIGTALVDMDDDISGIGPRSRALQ